jgi:hypothetical protein
MNELIKKSKKHLIWFSFSFNNLNRLTKPNETGSIIFESKKKKRV